MSSVSGLAECFLNRVGVYRKAAVVGSTDRESGEEVSVNEDF